MRIDRRFVIAGALVLAAAATAWACGPFFPSQLLDDRAGTLKATPTNSFAWEAARLVKPAGSLTLNEISPWERQGANGGELPADESAGLTQQQIDKVRAMRAAADGDAAWAAGEGLPEAIRLYTAGAVIYRKADPWCGPREAEPDLYGEPAPEPPPCDRDVTGALAKAAARFQAVLDLPVKEGSIRSVWAAYMLAQVHAAQAIASPTHMAVAREAFALTRQRAAAGDPDPAGLAIASFGEEARLYLTAAGCHWADFYDKAGCIPLMDQADIRRMSALYAEQAAHGSRIGVISLSMIANWSLREPARARAMAADPLMLRLMVSYALARLDDSVGADPDSDAGYITGEEATGASGIVDAGRGVARVTVDPRLVTLVEIIEAEAAMVEGADRLAALAYRAGRYDLAARLAALANTPMGEWVKAKLALRAGDQAEAAAAYARASAAFPKAGEGLEDESARLIKGEQGVLSLARGDYVEAMLALYQAAADMQAPRDVGEGYMDEPGYAEDAAYIAERVLTADELKTFVDAHAPASAAPVDKPQDDEDYWRARADPPVADTLRYLLGRRLIREERYGEALAYFPVDGDQRFGDPKAREHAEQFGRASSRAADSGGVSKAKALYEAAAIARAHGMEVMGYEQDPDFTAYGGTFGWGAGRSTPDWSYPPAPPPPTPAARAARDLPGPFVTDGERRRYAASEARPYMRYHYRYVAAMAGSEAADLLPPRSQAYAAVLCKTAQWLGTSEEAAPARAAVYKRYLNEGAYVPWAAHFGTDCPEPNFTTARWFWFWKTWLWARVWVPAHWYVPVALMVALGGLLAVSMVRRRRKA